MATFFYIMCALVSLACGVLLLRAYATSRLRLLLWSAICFGFLALNNLALVFDLVVWPDSVDLRLLRISLALAAVVSLIWGFVWEVGEE